MTRSLQVAGKGLMAATVALVLGFGIAQSVSAATRTNGPTARADCVEGNCTAYCQSLDFTDGFCPVEGGHCICS